jgi:uncharacterized integral membrane protein
MVLVVIVLFGGVFAVLVIENFSAFAAVTRLSFFLWQTPPLPVGLWLLISCLFGACMLYLASAIAAIQDRRELRVLRQRVAGEDDKRSAAGFSSPGCAYAWNSRSFTTIVSSSISLQ